MTPVVFGRLAELASVLGVQNISALPGCWEHRIDDQWYMAVNGHREPCKTDGTPSPVEVPPFCAYFEFNGWPAGIVSPNGGGTLAAGAAANEDALIAALEAAIRRNGGEPDAREEVQP